MSRYLLIVVFLCAIKVQAFETNRFSPAYFQRDSVKPEKKHSPKLATIYSAVLPGLGQAYNRKYWKIPIIYAALGISGYYIKLNKDSMRGRQEALTLMLDNDTNTFPAGKLAHYGNKSTDQLRAERNRYRTLRDYSIIFCAGFYILNIVDAAVDAHFYKFNIDKPLSMQRHKNWNIYSTRIGSTPAVGFSFRF
jgi:hypothetical protein